MTPAMITEISDLCSEAGMPLIQIQRVVAAVSGFSEDELQRTAAQYLADAWKRDHERDRPPQPTYLGPDVKWEAVPEPCWRLAEGRRCRFGKPSCKKPSVAELRRGSMGDLRDWWAYCAEHLFGRWVEDGQVMHWRRVT